MMQDEYVGRMGRLLAATRLEAKKSQEFMAHELGVSKMSIINWEKGVTEPRFGQFMKWFQVLGVNVHRPLLELIYPKLYEGLEYGEDEDKIEAALLAFLQSQSLDAKRQIFYILLGEHGSSPISLLQLFTAYLHLPMQQRVAISRSIAEAYEMMERREELVCPEYVLPDMTGLKEAIDKGKEAAIKGEKGYSEAPA